MPQQSPTYTQEVKAQTRRALLSHAVSSLTSERAQSKVVRSDMLQHVLEYASRFLVKHGFPSSELRDLRSIVADFLAYDAEQTGVRTPAELKVLYLAGPEPLNDLTVLRELGCRPQNVWAIEREGNLFASAVNQLREHDVFVRVHQGSLQTFFEQYGGSFDLVYFDGCGPLPGGQPNTLSTLLSLFSRERLSDLAALVTNFSEVPPERMDEFSRLMASYYAHRYNDVPRCLYSTGYDPAWGTTECLLPYVRDHLGEVYSEFVTRFVSELAGVLIPWSRIGATDSVMKKFFARPETWRATVEHRSADAYPKERPLLAFLEEMAGDQRIGTALAALAQHRIHGKGIVESFRPVSLLERAYADNLDLASEEMLAAYRTGWVDSGRQYFCDIPMPNLVFSTLAGVYARPLFANPERSLRLSYVAKTKRMYSDVFLFDRCRAFFDSVPSIELWPNFFASASRQLLFRSCIDQIGWHSFMSSVCVFWASALGGMGEHPAAYARNFPERMMVASAETSTAPAPRS